MIKARYPRILAGVLERRRHRDPAPAPLAKRIEEIALIQRTMARKARRETTRVIVASAGVAAMLGLAAVLLLRHGGPFHRPADAESENVAAPLRVVALSSGGGTIVTPTGSPLPLDSEMPFTSGSRLHVGPVAGAHLALSTGTRVAIEPGSDVAFLDRGRAAVFGLTSGSLRADVMKLADREQFIVQTADSEVEVRGTSFRVSIVPPDPDCGESTTTRVSVYEGVVTVRSGGHEYSVSKGDGWPRGCAPIRVAGAPANPAPQGEARGQAPRPGPRAAGSQTDVSNLAEQNDQFAEAMNLKRNGDPIVAVAAFERFLGKYPSSLLAENAAAERMKLLAATDSAKAAAAARQYLAKYPSGFARDDAKAILQR